MTMPKQPFTAASVKRGADWLRGLGADSDVVVSSRVRLARNVAGYPFLSKASRQQRAEVLDLCREQGSVSRGHWFCEHRVCELRRCVGWLCLARSTRQAARAARRE